MERTISPQLMTLASGSGNNSTGSGLMKGSIDGMTLGSMRGGVNSVTVDCIGTGVNPPTEEEEAPVHEKEGEARTGTPITSVSISSGICEKDGAEGIGGDGA